MLHSYLPKRCTLNYQKCCIFSYRLQYSPKDVELQNFFNKHSIEFVFNLGLTPGNIYFGVKGNEVYVIEKTIEGLKVFPLEEYIGCCWNDFIGPGKLIF